jgi:hypothetical protein
MNLISEALLQPSLLVQHTALKPTPDEYCVYDLEAERKNENEKAEKRLFLNSLEHKYPKDAPPVIDAEKIPGGIGWIGKTQGNGLVLTSFQLGRLRDYEKRNKLNGNPARRFGGYYVMENEVNSKGIGSEEMTNS